MKYFRTKLLIIFLCALGGWIALITLSQRADLQFYESHLELPPVSDRQTSLRSDLKVTFLGVTSLLFDDGETALMTDGFFTRPGLLKVLFKNLAPDEEIIEHSLKKAGVRSLAAVIPIHSHYDHVLDSPIVAKNTGATLIGSSSVANIGRSYHLPESQIRVVAPHEKIQLGKFRVTFIPSAHSPGAFFDGVIKEPVSLPAHVSRFEMGECYSLLIEHEGRKLLVHGSAGFIPNILSEIRADVIFLGIGTLGTQAEEYKQSYWREVVRAAEAKRVILIHWDNFFRPISKELQPLPWPIDNFTTSIDFLIKNGMKDNVDVRLPILWQAFDPFSNLDLTTSTSSRNR